MSFQVQARFGDVSVTIHTDGDYTPLIAEDMAGTCRRTVVRTNQDIEAANEVEMTLEEAQAQDIEE